LYDFEKTKPIMGDRYNLNEVCQAAGVFISVVV
jgi:hypothetical protein